MSWKKQKEIGTTGDRLQKDFLFTNAEEFVKKLRSLRTYCPQSYKEFLEIIRNRKLNTKRGKYQLTLYTSDEFKFVYGNIVLVYSAKKGKITLEDLLPSEFFMDGYFRLLEIYKGIPCRNRKDKFKVDLLVAKKKGRENEK